MTAVYKILIQRTPMEAYVWKGAHLIKKRKEEIESERARVKE